MNMAKFDRNIPYNKLPLLPPPINPEQDVRILQKLVTTSRSLAIFSSKVSRLPNPFMLINTIALQEAKTSTEIENIFTTEDELYKAISDEKKERDANPSTKEVLRYREALWDGYNTLKKEGEFTQEMIISIFRKISNSKSSIRAPQSQVVIKRGLSEYKPGEVIYTPPRGDKIIQLLMDNLFNYLNNSENDATDPLIKMCIAHYQFEAIHPFQDGNGRTGRILNLLYLVKNELLSEPFLFLSKYIIDNKDDYYFNLSGVTQRGDWTSWILYMLDAVEKTAAFTNSMLDEIINQMNATLEFASKRIKWYSNEVNKLIFSQPYIKAKTIGQVLNKTSRTTLTKYMAELTENRILSPIREGKEIYYINDDLVRILGK